MEEHDVFESRALEHAAGPELAILIASFGTLGGLHGIAAVMNAWLQRNEHKSITLTRGEETVDIHGLSKTKREAVVDRFLNDASTRALPDVLGDDHGRGGRHIPDGHRHLGRMHVDRRVGRRDRGWRARDSLVRRLLKGVAEEAPANSKH